MAKTKVVSYSELDTYRQCPHKHQLAYLEMWQTDDIAEALSRGTLFHKCLELHYEGLRRAQRGDEGSAAEVLHPQIRDLLREPGGGQTEAQELMEWMLTGYLEEYGNDPDWEVVAIEHPVEAWLPTEKGTRSSFKLVGTIDLVVRDRSAGGGLWIVDHKTCKNLPKGKDLDLEDQVGIYAYLLKQKGADIRGAIYNHVRTQKLKSREMASDERFKRTLTVRSDQELRTMALEALDAFRDAYRPRHERDARRHPDSERCGWKCGFTEACLAGRKGGDERAMLEDLGFHRGTTKPGPSFERFAQQRRSRRSRAVA